MEETKETALNLLTREGVVSVSFRPALTPEQYAGLFDAVHDAGTAAQLQESLSRVAEKWGLSVRIDAGV